MRNNLKEQVWISAHYHGVEVWAVSGRGKLDGTRTNRRRDCGGISKDLPRVSRRTCASSLERNLSSELERVYILAALFI